jgi:heme-degrading protein
MNFFKSVVLALVFSAIYAMTQAQVEEKKVLTLDGASKVIAKAIAEAKKGNSGGVIAVVDDSGNLMAHLPRAQTYQLARRGLQRFSNVQ